MPKHTSAKPTTPARPTPASSSAPTCATNAVDASVIAENETIETVIGQARRSNARPGLSDQVRDTGDEDSKADMTGLYEGRTNHRGFDRALTFRRKQQGLLGVTEEPAAEWKISISASSLHHRGPYRDRRAKASSTAGTCSGWRSSLAISDSLSPLSQIAPRSVKRE
jgi:hypothetical protein